MSITVTSTDPVAAEPTVTDEAAVKAAAEGQAPGAELAARPAEASKAEPVEENKESENEESEADEAGDEAEEGGEPGESQKAKGRTRNRIQKIRARAEAERARAEAAEREIAELRAKYGQSAEAAEPKVSSENGRPNPDDFETSEAYEEALIDWKVGQKLAAKEQQAKESEVRSSYEKQLNSHREKAMEFAEKNPEFLDLIEEYGDVPVSVPISKAFLEKGPEFQFELMKDFEEFERISSLRPELAVRALDRFEKRISAKAAQPKEEMKVQSKAPQPIAPTRSGAGTGSHKSIYDESLSFKDYEKLRAEGMR